MSLICVKLLVVYHFGGGPSWFCFCFLSARARPAAFFRFLFAEGFSKNCLSFTVCNLPDLSTLRLNCRSALSKFRSTFTLVNVKPLRLVLWFVASVFLSHLRYQNGYRVWLVETSQPMPYQIGTVGRLCRLRVFATLRLMIQRVLHLTLCFFFGECNTHQWILLLSHVYLLVESKLHPFFLSLFTRPLIAFSVLSGKTCRSSFSFIEP